MEFCGGFLLCVFCFQFGFVCLLFVCFVWGVGLWGFCVCVCCCCFNYFFFLNKERASVSNNTCTNSGMKNKDRYCKIHFQVLNSDIEKNIMFY